MIIGCWTAADSLLATIAPLGLASTTATALVVDAENNGPRYPSQGSLADLVAAGPRRIDLMPQRPGLAVLRNGGVDWDDAAEVVEALGEGWPCVVVRLPSAFPQPSRIRNRWPVVPVVPSLPHGYGSEVEAPFVAQATGLAARSTRAAAFTLPAPSRRTITALLAGKRAVGSRWIRAWRSVWEVAW